MNANRTSLSFGRYLQSIRMEKGISLEDVSKETRIRMDNLLLIEREDHEHLPAQIFVKGFLRSYAKAIGADEKEALQRYEDRYKPYYKVVHSERALGEVREDVWSNLRIALIFLFCVIVLSVYGASTFSKHVKSAEHTRHPAIQEAPAGTGKPDESMEQGNASEVPTNTESQGKKMLLKVTAVKDTWMKVIVDGQSAEKFSLSAGDRLEFEAFSGFNLLIGDASAVNLLFNDKPYEVTADSNQAVTIQLP